MNEAGFEYLAFISYCHIDISWARWLQESIEFYQLPTYIYDNHPTLPQQLRPIFRDETDLELGELNDRIHKALSKSKFLIVVCSPNSVKSKYVADEIEFFLKGHNSANVIPFIVSGVPYAKDASLECMPLPIRHLSEKPLAANINEFSKEYAMVKVVSYLLGGIAIRKLWDRYRIAKEEEEKRKEEERMHLLRVQSLFISEIVENLISKGDSILARKLAVEILPKDLRNPDRPYVPEAEKALRDAVACKSIVLSSNTAIIESTIWENGVFVAATMDDGSIKVWDRITGKLLSSINGGNSYGTFSSHVAFSSDGTYLLFDDSGKLIVSNLQTKHTHVIQTSLPLINAIIPLCNFNQVLVVGKAMSIWDIASGILIKEINRDEHEYGWRAAVCCEDKDIVVAITNGGGFVEAYSLLEPRTIIWKNKMIYEGDAIAYSKGLEYVAVEDGSYVVILDVYSGCERFRWKIGTLNYGSAAIALSHNGSLVAVASDYDICLFDITKTLISNDPTDLITTTFSGHVGSVSSLCFSSDDEFILSSSRDGTIRIFNISGDIGELMYNKRDPQSAFFKNALFIKNSTKMITRDSDGKVGIYDYVSCVYEQLLIEKTDLKYAEVSQNGQYYCTIDDNAIIHLYDVLIKKEIEKIAIYDNKQRAIRLDLFNEFSEEERSPQIRQIIPRRQFFSPDNRYLLIITAENPFQIPQLPKQCIVYSIEERREILRIPINHSLSMPAFSNDCSSLYITQENSLYRVSIVSGEISHIHNLNETISHILCPPNSNLIICASEQSITAYDLQSFGIAYRVDSLGGCPGLFVSISNEYCMFTTLNRLCIIRTESGVIIKDIPMKKGVSLLNAHYDQEHGSVLAVLNDLTDVSTLKDWNDWCCYIKKWDFPSLSNQINTIRNIYIEHPLSEQEKKRYYLV